MTITPEQPVRIAVDSEHQVSGLLQLPREALACCVLAHGAGAGMRHPFISAIAGALAERQIATLRYQFPFMEQGLKRPDSSTLARATVRAAVAEAFRLLPNLPLFAGGKSFGGRMTSQAQAELPMPGVRGLVFVGFPLHPAGKPSSNRAEHLANVRVPMLFLQGTRDALADLALLKALVQTLDTRAQLELFETADHAFHVPARSGFTDSEVLIRAVDAIAAWIGTQILPRQRKLTGTSAWKL